MWYAWDINGLVVSTDKNLKDNPCYETKKDAIEDIGFKYCEPRKNPTIKRIAKGYYIYTPRTCDGDWGEETVIINEKYLNLYNLKDTFNDLLNMYKKECDSCELEINKNIIK